METHTRMGGESQRRVPVRSHPSLLCPWYCERCWNRPSLSSGKTTRTKGGTNQRPCPPTFQGRAWGKTRVLFEGI